MELMQGAKHQATARNLAIKQMFCSCGSNTFIAYPVVLAAYNALNPVEVDAQPFGFEYQCKACHCWQALNHEQGKLPSWRTITQEAKDAIEAEALKALQEKAKV